jgi:sugar phosphate isomerase/epimerase
MPLHTDITIRCRKIGFDDRMSPRAVGNVNGGLLPEGDYALPEPSSSDPSARRRRLTIHHASGHQIVAFVEILSPGKQERTASVEEFVHTVDAVLMRGVHVMIVAVFPPGRFDPQGIPRAIWARYGRVEHLALGDAWADMSLFSRPG